MKEVETKCPCCESTLIVDVKTGKVLRHAPPAQVDEMGKIHLDEDRWDSASERSSSRPAEATSKFEQALGDERAKESRFEDLFDKAKKKVDERGKDEEPLS
jgi:hypothetical protein